MNIINNFLTPDQPESNFLGMFEGKRKARIEEERRKSAALAAESDQKKAAAALKAAQLASDLAIKEKAAGVVSGTDLAVLTQGANTKTYLILGAVLVLVVGIAVYFKFRKK